jgi:MYXO-CTERM domain-containing protein
LSFQSFALAQNVVGGEVVADDVWPDAAAVYYRNDVGCTGVLVAPDVVLTAGHCVGGIVSVKLDAADYRDKGEEITVIETIEYTNSWSTYDVAVLMLAQEAKTAPRLIASQCVLDGYYGDGVDVTMAGWGAKDANGVQYDTLLRAGDTLVEDSDCSDIDMGCNRQVSPDGELRAGGTGADACFGDSGGPLYLRTAIGDFLIGLTSRGYTYNTVDCGEGTIYVRADAIWEWIEDVSGRTLERFECDDDDPTTGTGNRAPVPTAEPITVVGGNSATTEVLANDPDAGDSHTFVISVAPAHGSAVANSGGVVTYTAPEDFEGADPFEVAVTDNGDPVESASLEIQVTVAGRRGESVGGGCGCAAGSSGRVGWGVGLLGLVVGLRRRRESGVGSH